MTLHVLLEVDGATKVGEILLHKGPVFLAYRELALWF